MKNKSVIILKVSVQALCVKPLWLKIYFKNMNHLDE